MRADAWTTANDDTIRNLAGSVPLTEIAAKLGRTYHATRQRASLLKIKVKMVGEKHERATLTDKQVRMARSLAACGYGLVDIQRECDLPISVPGLRSILTGEMRQLKSDCMADVVAQYELEINVLKQQYRQLAEYKGDIDVLIADTVMATWCRIRTILRGADYAYVYWCPVLKKFTVSKSEAKSDDGLLGVYSSGCVREDVKEDLYEVVDSAYRQI